MRPCLAPRCKALVPRGAQRCLRHQLQHDQEDAAVRGSAADRGYDREWAALSRAYLAGHPYCERHLRCGRRVRATLTDHKRPLREGGDRLDWRNLEALCRSCHAEKTHAERPISFVPPVR